MSENLYNLCITMIFYHDRTSCSNYCRLEVDYSVKLLEKLCKVVECWLVNLKVTAFF